MANDIIFYGDVAGDADITPTSEAAGYEKGFSHDFTPSTVLRASGVQQDILYDFGAKKALEGLAYFGTNIIAGDTTFKIKAGDTVGVVDEDEALTKAGKGFLPFTWDYRYYKIISLKAAGTSDFGKIMLFENAYTLDKMYNRGWRERLAPFFAEINGDYGQGQRTFDHQLRIFRNLFFEFIADSQKVLFDETISKMTDVAYYKESLDEIFYGWLSFTNIENAFITLWHLMANFMEKR